VVIADSANASSTGKIFTILFFNQSSSLALIHYLLVAEGTLVSQTVESSSPHPEVSASPRTHPASPQLEIQEPSFEPEKFPSPAREARNDVSMNTHLSIFI
jgi:hypothetical protein